MSMDKADVFSCKRPRTSKNITKNDILPLSSYLLLSPANPLWALQIQRNGMRRGRRRARGKEREGERRGGREGKGGEGTRAEGSLPHAGGRRRRVAPHTAVPRCRAPRTPTSPPVLADRANGESSPTVCRRATNFRSSIAHRRDAGLCAIAWLERCTRIAEAQSVPPSKHIQPRQTYGSSRLFRLNACGHATRRETRGLCCCRKIGES